MESIIYRRILSLIYSNGILCRLGQVIPSVLEPCAGIVDVCFDSANLNPSIFSHLKDLKHISFGNAMKITRVKLMNFKKTTLLRNQHFSFVTQHQCQSRARFVARIGFFVNLITGAL